MFGNGNNGCGTANGLAAGIALANDFNNGPSAFQAWQKACDGEFADQKALYDYALLDQNTRFNDRETINSQMFSLYKSQVDSDFGLYKNQRDQYDVLAERIGRLETNAAVNAAVEPWRSKVLQMEIGGVACMAKNLVALEAERRNCADNTIVNYANTTFYPISVANVTTGTTTTPRNTFNPLNECGCCVSGYGTSTTAPAA